MAFGVEYTLPCPLFQRTAHKVRAIVIGIVLYAGFARTSKAINDSSCLGYVAYIVWLLVLILLHKHRSNTLQSLVHCQRLLDVLDVGFILFCEGEPVVANKKAFALLQLKRGDTASLKKLHDQQQQRKAAIKKPGPWAPLDLSSTGDCGVPLRKTLDDSSLGLEWISTSL